MIDRMRHHDSRISADLAQRVEREARAQWGGQDLYVSKTSPAAREGPDPQRVRADLVAGLPTREVQRRHGISRATLYRLIKR